MTLQDYVDLFPGATREKTRFMALATVILRQAADLMAVTTQLVSGFALEAGVGKQLDLIAGCWGVSRGDTVYGSRATDEQFRRFLWMKLLQWQWDGTNAGAEEYVAKVQEVTRETDNMDGTVTVVLNGSLAGSKKDLLPIPIGISAN